MTLAQRNMLAEKRITCNSLVNKRPKRNTKNAVGTKKLTKDSSKHKKNLTVDSVPVKKKNKKAKKTAVRNENGKENVEKELGNILKNGISKEDDYFISVATTNTIAYAKKQKGSMDRLLEFATCYKNGIPFGKTNVKWMFTAPITNKKKMAFNSLICLFMLLFKKISIKLKKEIKSCEKKANCPFYQPSTQNQYLRTIFSALKEKYPSFPYALKFFSFTRGFVLVLTQLYQNRQAEFSVSLKKNRYLKIILKTYLSFSLQLYGVGSGKRKVFVVFLSTANLSATTLN